MAETTVGPKELIAMMQTEQNKLEIVQNNRHTLQNILREEMAAMEALKEIQGTKEGENILVPLGAGVYLETKLANGKEVQNSLTGDILLKEAIPEALKKLEDRQKDTIMKDQKLAEEQQRLMQNLRNIELALRQLNQVAQQKQAQNQNPMDNIIS